MPSDIFIIPSGVSEKDFTQLFLASKEFDMDLLKRLSRYIGLRITSPSKSNLITLLSGKINLSKGSNHLSFISDLMIDKSKEWISLQRGFIQAIPDLENPSDLIVSQGKSQWYGPINKIEENGDNVFWYIKPIFIENWTISPKGEPQKVVARWLCFARVTNEFISLHWQGFTYAEHPNGGINTQFPYWNHIPYLFEEIKDLTKAKMDYVNLHELMLDRLWDEYQSSEHYKWKHVRIRAESNGVSLNAHAGVVDELNLKGVLHLAETIRKSVQDELKKTYQYTLPFPEKFDGTILRTLIKEYGTLSYEFILEDKGGLVFRTHSYFGMKPSFNSPDSFMHMRMFSSRKSILSQLYFLLNIIRTKKYEDNKPQTIPMF